MKRSSKLTNLTVPRRGRPPSSRPMDRIDRAFAVAQEAERLDVGRSENRKSSNVFRDSGVFTVRMGIHGCRQWYPPLLREESPQVCCYY